MTALPYSTSQVRRAVAAATVSNVLAVLPVFLVAALSVPMRREFGHSEVGLGLAVSLFFGVSAFASIGGGWYAQRFGARASIAAGATGSALCLVGLGVLANDLRDLMILLALGGVANAISQPGANLVLAQVVPKRWQGVSFGLKQASVPIATLLAGLAIPVLALTVGWRWAFVAPVGLAVLLLSMWPRGMVPGGDPLLRLPAHRLRHLYGPLLVLTAAAAFGSAAANAMGAFFVESAVAKGTTEGAAGLWLSAGSVCGAGGRILWGWIADRRGGDHLRGVGLLMAAGAAAMVGLAHASRPGLVALATAVAFGAGWGWTGLLNFSVVQRHGPTPALAIGIVTTGVFLGGAIGPATFGLLVRHLGYSTAWTAAAAALLTAAGLVALRSGRALPLDDVANLPARDPRGTTP